MIARRPGRVLGALSLLALTVFIAAAALGSVSLGWSGFARAILGGGDATARSLIWELRLPRAATAFVTGGLLALAGALMQVLLRNPLADPYVLGISGGAAVGALAAMLAGLGAAVVSGGALAGAMLSTLLVFGLAQGKGSWTPTRLLLTGVVVAAGWNALVSLLLAIAPAQNLRGMLFWLMGDLSGAEGPGWSAALLPVVLAAAMALARPLDLLGRGELQASSLGVSVRPLRLAVFALASLATSTAVTLAGSVGFVGLIIPHMLRLSTGSDHRLLLPASVLLGGSFLVVADTLARTILAPRQLPVGVISAVIGVPVFLYLLNRGTAREPA